MKVGVVVVAHGKLAEELVRITRYIAGENPKITYVNVEKNSDIEEIKKKITEAIKRVDRGNGVLLLTDLFGGTPSNVCLSLMKKGKVEVVTGVNLPMLVKLATYEGEEDLVQIARFITSYGQKNIQHAGEVLYGRKRSKKDSGD